MANCIRSIQELVSLGVRFLAVTQNFDTDKFNPMSRFLLHILTAFAAAAIVAASHGEVACATGSPAGL